MTATHEGPEHPPLDRLETADVRPGDIVLATVAAAHQLTAQEAHALKTRLEATFPDNAVLVVHQVELIIARPATLEALPE